MGSRVGRMDRISGSSRGVQNERRRLDASLGAVRIGIEEVGDRGILASVGRHLVPWEKERLEGVGGRRKSHEV